MNNKTIYKHKFQHFPFHLVDPSPWPILLSFSLLNQLGLSLKENLKHLNDIR
jgi:hypothetical protein